MPEAIPSCGVGGFRRRRNRRAGSLGEVGQNRFGGAPPGRHRAVQRRVLAMVAARIEAGRESGGLRKARSEPPGMRAAHAGC